MLNYYVMHDIVTNLDKDFKQQFKTFDRIFFCSNYIKMMDFHRILSLKGNPYNLKDMFEQPDKKEAMLKFFITKTKELKQDPSVTLLTYGLIIHKSINEICKPYFDSLCGVSNDTKTLKKKQKLARIISYKLREQFELKNRDYKKVTPTYLATDVEMDAITSAIGSVTGFSNSKVILVKCQENLKFFYNQNINFLFFKIKYYNFLDKHSKSKVGLRGCLRTQLFKKKYDYLNINKREWLNPYTNEYETLSFNDIYKQIIDDVTKRIEKTNQLIFYTDIKDKDFTKKCNDIMKSDVFEIQNKKLVNPIFKRRTIFKTK